MGRFEARTEDLFKEVLLSKGYTEARGCTIDRQSCSNKSIDNLLANASKTEGSDRRGYPDFIVTNKMYPGIVMVAECKQNNADHSLAVQEAVGYARHIVGGGYDCITVGVSGLTKETLKISAAVLKADGTIVREKDTANYSESIIYELDQYEQFIGYTKRKEAGIISELSDIQNRINWILYEAGNLNSDKRMLILSACLLGLRDHYFRNSYINSQDELLLDRLLDAVNNSLRYYGIPNDKRETMLKNFKVLEQLTVLKEGVQTSYGTGNPLRLILDTLHYSSIHDMIEDNNLRTLNVDVMGSFYSEFITHGQDLGNAKNGFVLTPRHICELFADLGEIQDDTKILDMCFGTGGFLVAGMQRAIKSAKGDENKILNIKKNNICGVELDGDRFTYGCVNMILRGDGQSNMIQGNCFDESVKQFIKSRHCTVGMMNPPYALQTNEMQFVDNMLDCLEVGGRGIVIIPSSCTGNKNSDYRIARERILSKHTLEAVLSMPDQLFYPSAGVVTCVMIFTAHKPHNSERKTWFASCKDDGLVIDRKAKGRADINNKWKETKKKWVDAFIDRDVINGFSLKQSVTAKDEWSYEAYAKTDFEGITEESFKKVIKEYALFLLSQTEV